MTAWTTVQSMALDAMDEELDQLDLTYARLHTEKEDAYWTVKMGLGSDPGAAQSKLDACDIALARFLGDPARLARARELSGQESSETQRVRVGGWLRTFSAHVVESAEARTLVEELTVQNGALALVRSDMPLGYVEPGAAFVPASSVELSRLILMDSDEPRRHAAWQGLRSIENHLLQHGFIEIIKHRNRLGRLQGAEDFYDWKARQNEGMSKTELFGLLDDLEERTREAGLCAIDEARRRHGRNRVKPWSLAHLVAGDVTREQDPYFPFRAAIERWGCSFAALGVSYAGAELTLDLLDRPGKYENGFMHGPVVGWRDRGRRIPARIQFTANASPGKVGSGAGALRTLFHEGGHAAHFANIDMPSPSFGQEFAPTSAAFAETQSMFCDSLIEDADWLRRYARDASGQPMPMALIEQRIEALQPLTAWYQRLSLAVCYGERAIYELSDAELSAERVLNALRDVERRLLGLEQGSPRPVLSIPHVLSGDFSAYYHSYVLAQMAVHQARAFFLERDGYLVDNPRIGPELARVWWQPGNSVGFRELVQRLTGKPLSAEPLARHLTASVDDAKRDARASVQRLADVPEWSGPVELDARIRIVHGDQQVAELKGDFAAFSNEFASFIDAQVARSIA